MESDSEDEDLEDYINPEIVAEQYITRDFEAEKRAIMAGMLPPKSRAAYELAYAKFLKWLHENNTTEAEIDESKLIVYFTELKSNFKPTTLWSTWSKLRTTISLRHRININQYDDLKTLLKRYGKGFKPKKAKVFTWNQVVEFLSSSDSNIYLAHQVMLIFGIFGGLLCKEFVNLTTADIEDTGNKLIVSISDNKNDYPREFIISRSYCDTVRKYIRLRPTDIETNRFFIQFKHGKCTRQPIGKNSIGASPNTIANYLGLENPESYTGHSFRRTCATLLSNTGANVAFLKSHLGWRSDAVAFGYVEHSLDNRQEAFDRIANTGQNNRNHINSNNVQSTSSSHTNHTLVVPIVHHHNNNLNINKNQLLNSVQESSTSANQTITSNITFNNDQAIGIPECLPSFNNSVHNNATLSVPTVPRNNNHSIRSNNQVNSVQDGSRNNQTSVTSNYSLNVNPGLDKANHSLFDNDQRIESFEHNNFLQNDHCNKKRKVDSENPPSLTSLPCIFHNCNVTIHQLTVNYNYCKDQNINNANN